MNGAVARPLGISSWCSTSAPSRRPRPRATGGAAGPEEDPGDAQLREELAQSKAYVSSMIEQYALTNQALAESNEELQATNEELQSTNEELETAKEELQSSNEELTTVNDELQARYQEVNELSNDLQNLVTSADIPIVIVDRERKVRRFTPKARSAFNLLPGDLGRAIAEIRPNVDAPELDAWIAEVIETAAVKEAEVRDREGRWQRLQIRPYQTADRRIDGAVVSLVDIDALKAAVGRGAPRPRLRGGDARDGPRPGRGARRVRSASRRRTRRSTRTFRTSRAAARETAHRARAGGPWRSADLARRLARRAGAGRFRSRTLELECDAARARSPDRAGERDASSRRAPAAPARWSSPSRT